MRVLLAGSVLLASLLVGTAAPLGAQVVDGADEPEETPPEFLGLDLGFGISGSASITGGFYHARGIEARRPTENWSVSFGPTLQLPLGMRAGIDVMLSSEGRDFRQNINQFGISPTWGWGTLHLGDFSRNLSDFTVGGQRIRGAGLDLSPGALRFSVQAGRVQRATVSESGTTYDRDMLAARLGYGADHSAYLELNVVKARDDEASGGEAPLVRDTLLLDTIPEGLRPQLGAATGPQENLVAALAGRLPLLHDALVLEGEVAGALTTRDMTSPRASASSLDVPAFVDALHPLRLSTVADLAYRIHATGRFSTLRLQGGYERIGPGYESAGMAYIINDRQAFDIGGSGQLLGGRIALHAQFRHENNNLLEQRQSTTDREVANVTVALRASQTVTATLSAMQSLVVNDAAPEEGGLENRARSANASLSHRRELLGMPATFSVMYGLHLMDGHTLEPIPATTVHNVSGSVQLRVSSAVSLAPTISAVVRGVDGQSSEENIQFGFRGRGRFFQDRLRTSANLSHTISAGREVSSATARISYPVFTGATLSLSARHSEYSAFASRPAFGESFVTVGLNTSF